MRRMTRGFCPAGARTRSLRLSATEVSSWEPGNRRRPKSPVQFRRRLCRAVIIGNAVQARTGLITGTLDRFKAFEAAFLRRCERQLSTFAESALYAARQQSR
jgi:hypothetical protein